MALDMAAITERLERQFTRDVERFGERRVTSIERKVIRICAESMAAAIIAARMRDEQ